MQLCSPESAANGDDVLSSWRIGLVFYRGLCTRSKASPFPLVADWLPPDSKPILDAL